MRKMFRKTEAGFTLIEMLIVVLIVGVLAAAAAPIYLGYVKDAKYADAKALAGSALTALQACRQLSATAVCDGTTLNARIGVDPTTGNASGNRWQVVTIDNTLNLTGGVWGGPAQPIIVNGVGTDVTNLKVGINLTTGNFSTKCQDNVTGATFVDC